MKKFMSVLAVCLMLPQCAAFAAPKKVYTSPYGEKYHYIARCASKHPRKCTRTEAKKSGYSPCKKCVLRCVKRRAKKKIKTI